VARLQQELLLSGNEIGPSGGLVPVVETLLCDTPEEWMFGLISSSLHGKMISHIFGKHISRKPTF